jgi:acyl-coenzyme A synthetase/AMP-(fatty) acid ligase
MEPLPLLSHSTATAVVAYRGGRAVTAGEFLADADRVAARLPAGRHVLNACADRYRFSVGLAACLITGRVSLLPSTHTAEVVRQLLQFAPDAFCLTDASDCDIELPLVRFPEESSRSAGPAQRAHPAPPGADYRPPLIPAEQLAAIVFTSGSTGAPLPYRKTWGRLVACVRGAAAALGVPAGAALIGTVPAQHMYGFESTVLLALLTGNAFTAARPFYPADVRAALEAAPRSRVLITTPVHLRAVLAEELPLPVLDLIVSATAPLPQELAREAERRFGAPLLEIYGATETGQIAIRHTARHVPFTLLPGVRLRADNGQTYAYGGHVEQMTALCDVLEPDGDTRFVLRGRTADLVNIAGKRTSFGYLNAQLNAIPGVQDGVFFLRESNHKGITGIPRLAAAVVAPTLSAAALMRQLRRRIDPVFLPRPLVLVERLPRNATGKLPQQSLQALTDRLPRRAKTAAQSPRSLS